MMTDDADLTPYGSCRARSAENDSETLYSLIPGPLAAKHDVEKSDELPQFYHAPTGCLITVLHPVGGAGE